ncbi:MAG TPA: TRAP transporter small permease [Rubrivivax sp.]|nr:TRAP transporter small permease [Rubrivivax sp.]
MSRLLHHFYRLLICLAALSMVAAFVAVMLGILSRQMGFNIRGLDAYAGYSIASALFLALPETLRHGDHIRVTLVLQKVPAALRTVLEYWGLLAGLCLTVYVAWFACRLAWLSKSFNDVSQGADATPLWIPQLTMALGCIGFAVAFADALVARIQGRPFFLSGSNEAARVE